MNISELNVICLKWRGLIFKWSKMHDWAASFCTSTYVLTWVSACFCVIISLQCFPVNVEHCVTNTVPPSSWDIFAVSFVKQLAGGTSPRRAFGWALSPSRVGAEAHSERVQGTVGMPGIQVSAGILQGRSPLAKRLTDILIFCLTFWFWFLLIVWG